MGKVLVVDDEPQIREIYELILESTGVEVLVSHSGNHAIEMLKNNKDIELVFSDYRMDDGDGSILFQWMKRNCPSLPFVLVSTYDPSNADGFDGFFDSPNLYHYITKPFSAEQLFQYIKQYAGKKLEFANYQKFKLLRLISIDSKDKFEVNIKLHDEKLVKIIDDSDDVELSILQRYANKGVIWCYLKDEIVRKLIDQQIHYCFEKLDSLKGNVANYKKVQILSDVVTNVRDMVQTLGMDQQTMSLIEKSVEALIDFHSQPAGIVDLLKMLQDKDSYISKHGILTFYIAQAVLIELDWDTDALRKKIGMASLFQNISLDFEYLAKIHSIDDSEFEKLHPKEKNIVLEHPRKSAAMLVNKNIADDELIAMIQKHHESPYGNGFPQGLGIDKLSQNEGIIIICSHMANCLLNSPGREVSVLAQDFNELYNKGSFKKIYLALLQVFLDKHT